MSVSLADFDFVSTLLRQSAAIVLEPAKEYLVDARLSPLAQREGFNSLGALVAAAKAESSLRTLRDKMVDALTTNETSFFRDFHPFEALRRQVLPGAIEAAALSNRRICIWSGACSTGQEPYTIAMLIREHFPTLNPSRVEIIATDLSPTVLAKAKAGIFSQLEVNRGLPAAYLVKYFQQAGKDWQISAEIRSMITFRPLNLIEVWTGLPPLDVIFLRNVMIYFDAEIKKTILKRLRLTLRPNGTLFLGTAETTLNLDPGWVPLALGNATAFRAAA